MLRVFHVTDNPDFRLRYDHAAEDMLWALKDRPVFGVLFVALNLSDFFWENIHFYRTPRYVVQLTVANDTPDEYIVQGRWFPDEMIITDPYWLNVERVIPTMPCKRIHKFGIEWGPCDGRLNPWGSRCSSCKRRPARYETAMIDKVNAMA